MDPQSLSPAPPSSFRLGVLRFRVTGGGYLDGVDTFFVRESNVICGGPGVGKSTLLELIRFALGLPVPDAKKEEIAERIASNLGPGRVHVTLGTAHGTEVEVSRAGGEAGPRVDSPKSLAGPFDPDSFPVRFVGHGELDAMATNGLARLDLIARFAWEDFRRIKADLARVRGELDANAAPLVRLDREIGELAKRHATLPQERARLEELKKAAGGDPVDLGAAQQRKGLGLRERAMVERADAEMAWLAGQLGVFVATARRRLGQCADADAMAGPHAPLLEGVGKRLDAAVASLESMAGALARDCESARASFKTTAHALAEVHSVEEDAFRALLAKHDHNAARAFERLELEKRISDLERAKSEHDARLRERRQLMLARDALRARARALVGDLTALLERTGAWIHEATAERVQVIVHPEAERTAYRALLGVLVKGKRFEAEQLDVVAASVSPEDLFAQVLRGDASVLEDKLGSKAIAMRLVATLLESPRVYELETVDVPHVPSIELLHGKKYKPSSELSSGQRTVAFASILLLDRRGPLIIDQPEDNVANKYLAQYLCGVLADVQKEMQLIFVTHNGNIPILGRAKRVFELDADGERGWVASQGSLDEAHEPMEDNFEGGREAFAARKDFYGI